MEYYRHAKQIVLANVREIGIARTVMLHFTETAALGFWFAVILFI